MPGEMSSLHELCLLRTARMLKNSYWDPELPLSRNPFASMPSDTIDTLITYVIRISTSEWLCCSDLRLLITSGRVRQFILQDGDVGNLKVDGEHLEGILMDLSSSCRYLTTVKICISRWYKRYLFFVTRALNGLLSEARNIKHVESCIEFDLRVLRNCFQLQKLILHFPLERSDIQDILKFDGQLRPHTSLKHLEVLTDSEHSVSYLDVAVVLTYCTELISTNLDISKSLEHLHVEELHNGSITHKYKIKKCLLGHEESGAAGELFRGPGEMVTVATTEDVLIASLTCPHLRDVELLVNDYNVISPLRDCQNLATLKIKFPSNAWERNNSFQMLKFWPNSGINPGFGHSLISLELSCSEVVDFPSIGVCCPNLEVLIADYWEASSTGNEYSPTSFRKLQSLYLSRSKTLFFDDVEKNVLIGILSNAADLKELRILCSGELTDDVLRHILKKNSFPKLKKVEMPYWGLSADGLRSLVRGLTALERLFVHSAKPDFRAISHVPKSDVTTISDVVRDINPGVIVTTDELNNWFLV